MSAFDDMMAARQAQDQGTATPSAFDDMMAKRAGTAAPVEDTSPDVTTAGALRQSVVPAAHNLAGIFDMGIHEFVPSAPSVGPWVDRWAKQGLSLIGQPYQEPKSLGKKALQYGVGGAISAAPMIATGAGAVPVLAGGLASGAADPVAEEVGLTGWKRAMFDLAAGVVGGGGVGAVKSAWQNLTGKSLEQAGAALSEIPGDTGKVVSSARTAEEAMDQKVQEAYGAIKPEVAQYTYANPKPLVDKLAALKSEAGEALGDLIPQKEAEIIERTGEGTNVADLQALRTRLGNTGRMANRAGNSQTAHYASELKSAVDDSLATAGNPEVADQLKNAVEASANYHRAFGRGTPGAAIIRQGSDYTAVSKAMNAGPEALDDLLSRTPGDVQENLGKAFVDKALNGQPATDANLVSAQRFFAKNETAGRRLMGDANFEKARDAIDAMKVAKATGKPPTAFGGLLGGGILGSALHHMGVPPEYAYPLGLGIRYAPYGLRVVNPGLRTGAQAGGLGGLFPATSNPLFDEGNP